MIMAIIEDINSSFISPFVKIYDDGRPSSYIEGWRWHTTERMIVIKKIISGAQTGADRAALDVAIRLAMVIKNNNFNAKFEKKI